MKQAIKIKRSKEGKCWLAYFMDGLFDDQWVPLPFTFEAPRLLVIDTLKKSNPEYIIEY